MSSDVQEQYMRKRNPAGMNHVHVAAAKNIRIAVAREPRINKVGILQLKAYKRIEF